MRPIKIITDSCSDLGADIRKEYDIAYCKMNTVYKGEETPASLDWENLSSHEFYEIMRNPANPRITTSQVPMKEYQAVFGKYIEEGYDIIYIGCSSALSGSVNTAQVVASSIMDDNSEANIYVIDSLNACLGEGLLAVQAASYVKEGYSVQEIVTRVSEIRNNVNQYCTAATLEYLRRAGRVKATSAFFGNLLQFKPIIISNSQGQNVAAEKVRGRRLSIKTIIQRLKESIVDSESQTIYVAHADCEEEGKAIVETIKAEIPCKNVYLGIIGPIIGASVGPDAVAVFALGKEVA